MKLRTSFFNIHVLKKNLIRFAPLWVLYAVGEVLCLLMLRSETDGLIAGDLNYIMGPVSIFHAVYALIVAACLFGDLFDSRMCNGLHAMPMRREGWLLTNLASALVFALIPAVVGGTVAGAILGKDFWIALVWQGTSLLQFVFFFGVAVFSAMCAGKRLGMIAIYAILNFLAMLIFWIATLIYEPLLPGVVLDDDIFALFCPVVSMATDVYMEFYYDKILGGFFRGFIPEAWHYLYICAGTGVVFTVLGWLLYRKRHLETAGDFVSFRPMGYFFLLAYTLTLGVLLYSFGELFGFYKDSGFLVVGILIGYFTGWMLLERTVKIFTKKVLVGFAAFAVLFTGSIGLTILDPMGIAVYIPQTEKTEAACLYLQNDSYAYSYRTGSFDEEGWWHRAPEELVKVQDLHRKMIEQSGNSSGEYITVNARYQMKNGHNVYRSYQIPADSAVAAELKPFFSDTRAVFATDDWGKIQEMAEDANVYLAGEDYDGIDINDPQQLQMLLAAIEADCKAGLFAQHDYFHMDQEYVGGINITWETVKSTDWGAITRGEHVTVYEDCVNVRAFLETLKES